MGGPVDAVWAELSDGTAIVEMARASGLALVARNDALAATTFGTGELIAAAIDHGCHRVIVGVGGSATTDGGIGALDALGWSLRGIDVEVACDVTTTFLDAPAIFGPQKGASPSDVAVLEERLRGAAARFDEPSAANVVSLPGSGAAGGLAGGLAAVGARIVNGFDVVAAATGFAAALETSTAVITGEGKVDASTLTGKVVARVLDAARTAGTTCRGDRRSDRTGARPRRSHEGAERNGEPQYLPRCAGPGRSRGLRPHAGAARALGSVRDDHERTGGVVGDVLTDRAEQQPLGPTEPTRTDDEERGACSLFDEDVGSAPLHCDRLDVDTVCAPGEGAAQSRVGVLLGRVEDVRARRERLSDVGGTRRLPGADDAKANASELASASANSSAASARVTRRSRPPCTAPLASSFDRRLRLAERDEM